MNEWSWHGVDLSISSFNTLKSELLSFAETCISPKSQRPNRILIQISLPGIGNWRKTTRSTTRHLSWKIGKVLCWTRNRVSAKVLYRLIRQEWYDRCHCANHIWGGSKMKCLCQWTTQACIGQSPCPTLRPKLLHTGTTRSKPCLKYNFPFRHWQTQALISKQFVGGGKKCV